MIKSIATLFIVLLVSFANASTFPLNNAFLQTDLNGNQKKITNLLEMDVTFLNASNLSIGATNIVLTNGGVWQNGTNINASIYSSQFLPQVVTRANTRGQLRVSAPFTITNTLSDGFTNLNVYDNLVWGTGNQVEIVKFIDAHTVVVFEGVQVSDTPTATNYDIYHNSANLWDVNGQQNDYQNHTHGAITSDGGLAVSTGYGHDDAQTGWSYGMRITEGTNAWRLNALHLGARGPGLDFGVGGDNTGDPFFISSLAPYESLEVFADGSVSVGSLTNWRGDLSISSVGKIAINATNGVDANGLLSIKQSSRFLPQVNFSPLGRIRCSASHTFTNTLAYGFTNLHVFDNLVVGNSQYEIIGINNGSNLFVFENVNVGDFGGTSNYAVYVNSANLWDVNGDQPDYLTHYHGAITSDGGLGVVTGAYNLGYGFGLRLTGATNSWRLAAKDLSGVGGPVLAVEAGGCNNAVVMAISTLAPFESLTVIPDGETKIKVGLLMQTNSPPTKAFAGGAMFYWNSNGANLYLLKSSLVNSNWTTTNLIN